MISLPDTLAGVMLVGLIVYALSGGADFGGGVWDLLAHGPRAAAQRKLIERAIAPVWEANHVWLIFVVTILFTAFPPAFSVAMTALHVPVTLMLLGIILRGSAFAFRQYGADDDAAERRWGRVFAIASVVTPFFLGVTLAAVTGGGIRVADGVPTTGFFSPWIGIFPFAVGLFTLALFAFLAAVYLTVEADEPELADDFRFRALAAGVAVGACALAAALTLPEGAAGAHFRARFLGSPWTWPLQLATGAAAVGALGALVRRRWRLARALAIAQTTLILAGWGASHYPYLIAPDVPLAAAAAPRATLAPVLGVVLVGMALLAPSLYWLLRIFKAPAVKR